MTDVLCNRTREPKLRTVALSKGNQTQLLDTPVMVSLIWGIGFCCETLSYGFGAIIYIRLRRLLTSPNRQVIPTKTRLPGSGTADVKKPTPPLPPKPL